MNPTEAASKACFPAIGKMVVGFRAASLAAMTLMVAGWRVALQVIAMQTVIGSMARSLAIMPTLDRANIVIGSFAPANGKSLCRNGVGRKYWIRFRLMPASELDRK